MVVRSLNKFRLYFLISLSISLMSSSLSNFKWHVYIITIKISSNIFQCPPNPSEWLINSVGTEAQTPGVGGSMFGSSGTHALIHHLPTFCSGAKYVDLTY